MRRKAERLYPRGVLPALRGGSLSACCVRPFLPSYLFHFVFRVLFFVFHVYLFELIFDMGVLLFDILFCL